MFLLLRISTLRNYPKEIVNNLSDDIYRMFESLPLPYQKVAASPDLRSNNGLLFSDMYEWGLQRETVSPRSLALSASFVFRTHLERAKEM